MPRPRTGSAWFDRDLGRWIIQATIPARDGKPARRTKPVVLEPGTSEAYTRDQLAVLVAAVESGEYERDDRGADAESAGGETVTAYAKRWLDAREAAGIVSVEDDRARYRVHVDPVLGPLPVAKITKDDVRRLVAALDDRVRDEAVKFSWKTAGHVWVLVRTLFRDACSSKRPELVVRDDDPTDKVRPPDRGDTLDRTYLHPSEFAKLVGCVAVPVHRRRLYALAAYTLSRAGELRALRWEDVDLERGVISFRQASDKRGGTKRTKTGKSRRIPIEPTLRPLLDVLKREADAEAAKRTANGEEPSPLVAHVPHSKNADLLRRDLETAGLTRAALFAPKADASNAATWAPLDFHDLRGTGVTWLALRGVEPLVIQQRAGHADFATTQRYLREAETFGRDGGQPFPALPADLLRPEVSTDGPPTSERSTETLGKRLGSRKRLRFSERDTGFEPATLSLGS